ncbi:MAG: hypothetical protein ACRCY8_17375, partial [Dermatophilaceae bacterium]
CFRITLLLGRQREASAGYMEMPGEAFLVGQQPGLHGANRQSAAHGLLLTFGEQTASYGDRAPAAVVVGVAKREPLTMSSGPVDVADLGVETALAAGDEHPGRIDVDRPGSEQPLDNDPIDETFDHHPNCSHVSG